MPSGSTDLCSESSETRPWIQQGLGKGGMGHWPFLEEQRPNSATHRAELAIEAMLKLLCWRRILILPLAWLKSPHSSVGTRHYFELGAWAPFSGILCEGGQGCFKRRVWLWSVRAAAALPRAAVSSSASPNSFPQMGNSLNWMAEPPSQGLMLPTAQTGSGQSVRGLHFCTPQSAFFVGLNNKWRLT